MDLRPALAAALKDAERQLAETEKRLAEIHRELGKVRPLQEEMAQLNGLVLHLREEQRGLRMALARHRGQPVGPDDDDWANYTRNEAVYRILREAGRPMSPGDIAKGLAERGREDPANAISVTLVRMRNRGLVTHGNRGEWLLAAPSDNGDHPARESEVVR